jgi:RNA polymerase sigma-70 factor (ECF subfamily)
VLSGRARHDGRSTFKTWFFGVVRLTAMEHGRGGGVLALFRRSVASSEPDDLAAPSRPDPAVASETARAVASALAELPERQREVLHLAFYEGLTIAEAAEVMGVSLGTARQHYERGKARMHATLERRGVRP